MPIPAWSWQSCYRKQTREKPMAIDSVLPSVSAVLPCNAFPPQCFRLASSPSFIPPNLMPLTATTITAELRLHFVHCVFMLCSNHLSWISPARSWDTQDLCIHICASVGWHHLNKEVDFFPWSGFRKSRWPFQKKGIGFWAKHDFFTSLPCSTLHTEKIFRDFYAGLHSCQKVVVEKHFQQPLEGYRRATVTEGCSQRVRVQVSRHADLTSVTGLNFLQAAQRACKWSALQLRSPCLAIGITPSWAQIRDSQVGVQHVGHWRSKAAAGKGLRRDGAQLPHEHLWSTESLPAQHWGHPSWLASRQHDIIYPVVNYPFPLLPFPAKLWEA